MKLRNWLSLATTAAALMAPQQAGAQLATLVGDPPSIFDFSEGVDSRPGHFAVLGARAVFFATEGRQASSLWVTDGTPEGTQHLAETCAGCTPIGPSPIARTPNLFYFTHGSSGTDLWRTDGTTEGTFALTEPGQVAFSSARAIHRGDTLLAFGFSASNGPELWISDGSPAGTRMIQRFVPSGEAVLLYGLAAFGNGISFLISRGRGIEIWTSDGTAAGTRHVVSLPRSLPALGLDQMAVANGRFFFRSKEATSFRREIWASDGTAAGTSRLLLGPEPNDLSSTRIVPLGDRVFFSWSDELNGTELWSSNGTPAGTRAITDLPETMRLPTLGGRQFARLGERVLFVVSTGEGGVELLATEVDRARVTPFAVLDPGRCGAFPGAQLVPVRERVLFEACNGSRVELRSTDGTLAGTERLRSNLQFGYGAPSHIPGDDDLVYFLDRGPSGMEIFSTDGTPNGTRRKTQLPGGDFDSHLSDAASKLGDLLLFSAEDNRRRGTELWSVGITPDTTRLLADISRSDGSNFVGGVAGIPTGALFHTESSHDNARLWRTSGGNFDAEIAFDLGAVGCRSFDVQLFSSGARAFLLCPSTEAGKILLRTDGTLEGTAPLFAFPWEFSRSEGRAELGGFSYFGSMEPPGVLWRTDGTASGSQEVVSELDLGATGTAVLTSVGDSLYFVALGSVMRVFRSDGTREGTEALTAVQRLPLGFHRLGAQTVFLTDGDSAIPPALWATDGTPTGTRVLLDLSTLGVDEIRSPRGGRVLGDMLFFYAESDNGSLDLWSTDGTAGGTRIVWTDVFPELWQGSSPEPVVFNGAVYFTARTPEAGVELWRTDGTADGTHLVRDIELGSQSASPYFPTPAGDRLVFSARSNTLGRELWVTNGTTEGTRLLHDLAPGPLSSSPDDFNVIGNRLYFTADDGIHGRELWSLNLDESGCVPNDHALCLQDNRFRVEVDWRNFQGQAGRGTAVALTEDTGYFWFFNPNNVEAVLKVLDGRGLNDHFWTFYGALSTVEYNLTITDAQTGVSRRYYNPPGHLASRADTASFGPDGASLERFTPPAEEEGALAEIFRRDSLDVLSPRGSCAPVSNRLCLRNGRFAVEATWRDFQGNTGTGTAIEITGDTGTFWFFRPENLEVILKVLDGTGLNGKHWVFYGALSSVEYTLTVTDTQTGAVKTYFNPLGRLASVADTGAF